MTSARLDAAFGAMPKSRAKNILNRIKDLAFQLWVRKKNLLRRFVHLRMAADVHKSNFRSSRAALCQYLADKKMPAIAGMSVQRLSYKLKVNLQKSR